MGEVNTQGPWYIYLCHNCGWISGWETEDLSCYQCGEPRNMIEEIEVVRA